MDRRTARSLDTDLKSSRRSLSLLSLSHPKVHIDCNPLQFLAIAIREASVMFMYGTINLSNPAQYLVMEMILVSVI